MIDLTLLVAIFLLFVTAIASVAYYKEIRKVQEEYERAKDIIGDVIVSVNTDIERERQKLSVVSGKTEMLLSENGKVQRKIEGYNDQLSKLATKIEDVSGLEPKLSAQFEEMRKSLADVINSQKHLGQRVTKIERLRPKVSAVEEAQVKAAIPIRRDRALASLTQTELDVLEVLATEGGKTAPEIKERINLTREHTARLMKSLYERGYLERSTEKIPYSYSIKDVMRKILKKPPEPQ